MLKEGIKLTDKDYIKVFKPEDSNDSEQQMIAEALKCLDEFGDHFNAEELDGMDRALHFPHILLSGNDMIVWDEPGQLPASFFDDLKSQGWATTVSHYREPMLVSPNKVHFKVK